MCCSIPTEYSFERTNSYKATPVPGLGSPLLQFVNGECDQLSMELFLDDYTDPKGPTSLLQQEKDPVAKRLRDLSKLLEIDRDLHAPPPVRFNWGPMEFTAVIEKLGRKVTMFHPDGTPARATLSVSFKEYRTLRKQLEDPRRESADKTKRRVVVGRERALADRGARVRRRERMGADRRRPTTSTIRARSRPATGSSLPPSENPNGTRDPR